MSNRELYAVWLMQHAAWLNEQIQEIDPDNPYESVSLDITEAKELRNGLELLAQLLMMGVAKIPTAAEQDA